MVVFPSNNNEGGKIERQLWFKLLDIRNLTAKEPRVWVGHFHNEDIQVKRDSADSYIYDGLVRGVTRHVYGRNNSASSAPPRPAASKQEALSYQPSLSYASETGQKRKSLSDSTDFPIDRSAFGNVAQAAPTTTVPSFTTETPATQQQTHPSNKGKPGPKLGSKKPLTEAYVGHVGSLLDLINTVQEHALTCKAKLTIRRSNITRKGLALKVKYVCARGENCSFHPPTDGSECKWNEESKSLSCLSCEMYCGNVYSHDSFKPVPLVDAVYAFANAISPGKKKHYEDFLTAKICYFPLCDY